MVFKDASMLIDRTGGVWGAIGALSYGLLFAFIESTFIFLLASLLGLLISATWDEPRRIVLIGLLVTLTLLWTILGQSYSVWNMHVPGRIVRFVSQFPHLFIVMYAAVLAFVPVITLLPVFLILHNEGFYKFARAVTERITLLSGAYLAFDALALIVIIIRNI
jgi:hypothetical protein